MLLYKLGVFSRCFTVLTESISHFVRKTIRLTSSLVLGPFSPRFKLEHFSPALSFVEKQELIGLRDFSRQECLPGLTSTHLLVGRSTQREVWLDSGLNFLVCGSPGTGKSVLESFLVFQRVAKDQPVLILDWIGNSQNRERLQSGLSVAGLKPLKHLELSEVHCLQGVWQGNGLEDTSRAMEGLILALERISHALSAMDAPLEKHHLIVIPDADWLLYQPDSIGGQLVYKLLAQIRSKNASLGLFSQRVEEKALANCSTYVDFNKQSGTGVCEVRTNSRSVAGVSKTHECIQARVPFFYPSAD